MKPLIIYLLSLPLFYLIGCFSSSRLLAKYFRSLNIYKVGTGHPDTENIFHNVSKPLGILAGLVDLGKMYLLLQSARLILSLPYFGFGQPTIMNLLLLTGFFIILGHCFPLTHKFRGGRGMFSYIGFVLFFAPLPMLIVAICALFIIIKFAQNRFAKFMLVLLPPLLNFIPFFNTTFQHSPGFIGKMWLAAAIIGILNILVSKKLGEL
ncbi:MAG: glycerol-3-phosphate acyltransferase [Candidatus Cloacimonadales bacterium]